MKKLVVLALAALAIGTAVPSGADVIDGCIALPRNTCEYVATMEGSIVGVGDWLVEIWGNGACGPSEPDWIRARSNGDNNLPGGRAGTSDGSIPPGACVRATAYGNSVVAVGMLLVPEVVEPPTIPPDDLPSIPPDLPSIPPSLPPLPLP